MQDTKGQSVLNSNSIKRGVVDSQLSSVVIPDNVTRLLDKTHEGVADIVDIRVLEFQETNLFAIFGRAWKDRICLLLGVNNVDPKVFAQMTETLNKSRNAIVENKPEQKVGKNDKVVSIKMNEKQVESGSTLITYDKAA